MAVIKVCTLAIPLLGISPSAHLNTTPLPPDSLCEACRGPECTNGETKAQRGSPLLSSPPMSPQKKKNVKK